jgi:cobalt-zinc-cadmium efflux system outer membrane protein
MTLPEALSLALMHNPELRAFSWEVRAAGARTLQVGLWPNPEIGINIENVAGTNGISGLDGRATTLQLGQLLELGGKRAKRTTVASLEKEISQWDYEAKRLEVFSAAVKAFVEALAAQERLSLAEDMGRLSGELVETVSQRVEAGKDSPVEKAKAGVVLSNARIRRQQAIKDLEFSYKQLAATWGSTSPRFKKVSGLLSVAPVPVMEELTALLEWNPSIVRSSLAVDRQKAAMELEKAKAVSDITLSGGVRRFEQTDDGAMVFGFAMPIPLLNRNQGGRLEATYNLARAREEHRAVRTALEMELAAGYQSLSNAYIELDELDANILQSAESLFEASREGYTQGKLDYLELLDAQRTLFDVRAQYIEALRSYHLAKADVERLIRRDISTLPGARETRARPRY